ncbi:hypothetical protein [Candidatus Tisiphia endosymbiont of Oplodontha viridula]|uniref:hypothetical protein n=1 Tax=Candidatus Tisiphia endosymbiont of Oplodontha viridula TaxID=3077925 RepID=UPI0035C90275
MFHPNTPDTPRILGSEKRLETPPLAKSSTMTNLHFEKPMLLEAWNHCIILNGHNFFIQLLSLTADGHLVLDYNDKHYEHELPNSTIITLGNNVEFTDFL